MAIQNKDPKADLVALMADAKLHGVTFIYKRNSWFHTIIGWFLYLISFGQLDGYIARFITTIGQTIALCDSFDHISDLDRLAIISHELKHVEQYKQWSFVYCISYLFLPLPIGFAYCRWVWERAAYLRQMEVLMWYGANKEAITFEIDFVVQTLSGSSYLWTWPFKESMRDWFMSRLLGVK